MTTTHTQSDRAAVHDLAAHIVESVSNDAPLPIGMTKYEARNIGTAYYAPDVESLVMQLAQEICALRQERDALKQECAQRDEALMYLAYWKGNDQHQANADEIAAGNAVMEDGQCVRRKP